MYLALGELGAETKKLLAHQTFLFSKSLSAAILGWQETM